jgi:pimeloyl-ACP methyl ester carboxylesterase
VPEPFTLVGHSLGAYLAARLLGELGDRVERAVFVGGFPTLPEPIVSAYLGLAAGIESGAVEPRAAIRGAVEAALGASAPEPARALLHAIASEWPVPRIVRLLRRVAEVGAASAVSTFDTRAVVLHAADDASVPIALGRDLAALGQRAKLRELDEGGHFLQLSRPELVAALAFSRD